MGKNTTWYGHGHLPADPQEQAHNRQPPITQILKPRYPVPDSRWYRAPEPKVKTESGVSGVPKPEPTYWPVHRDLVNVHRMEYQKILRPTHVTFWPKNSRQTPHGIPSTSARRGSTHPVTTNVPTARVALPAPSSGGKLRFMPNENSLAKPAVFKRGSHAERRYFA
ncbi:hypothetical protein JCM3770_000177 [Rhodotorula araucariae]